MQPLTRDQFNRLQSGEELFVHSYGGRRWLCPPPARSVNHSDHRSCYQHFECCCDVARRRIEVGEAFMIEPTQGTSRELSTFLEAYVDAQQRSDHDRLNCLISADTVRWEHGCSTRGVREVVTTRTNNPAQALVEAELPIATGRPEALCSAGLRDTDSVTPTSLFLRLLAGNWQVVYEHRG